MHAAFSYDRRDPYARLPLEHVSSANDPSTTTITSVNNVNDHVSKQTAEKLDYARTPCIALQIN